MTTPWRPRPASPRPRCSRISEYQADAAAARWGYAAPLADAYEGLAHAEAEPVGRLERLRASHPPIAERIELLRGAAANAAPTPIARR